MTDGSSRGRSDFFEPVRGWRVWRRGAKRNVTGGPPQAAVAEAERPGAEATDGTWPAAPDYLEPVLGWRIWRVVKCKGRYVLASLFNNVVWVPGTALDARCFAIVRLFGHRAPDEKCHCGIYAARREAIDWELLGRRALTPLAVGRVYLWGPVVEAERGWRAEHAYPERLFVPSIGQTLKERDHRIVEGLEAYGVPVRTILVEHASSLLPVIDVLGGDPPLRASA